MKAALYVRVSTDAQAEEGFSIQAQLTFLKEYCNKNLIEIYSIYSDEGISGQTEKRPQFQRMIKDAGNKAFNIILVHKYDRFARKVELSQRIKTQLSKSGVNVISITEPIEDSPMGFFVSGLHELMAEYYVKNLSQEVKKGMRERVKQGLSNGSVPYGYKTENGIMTINEEQAAVIRKIFEMYNDGNGSSKISQWLDDNGIPSAVPGARWNHYAVLYILRNVKYIGYIKHAGEVYQGLHEPIIDKETFDLAQGNRKDRLVPREPKGKNESKFALLGLLRCGVCGYKMIIHTSNERHGKKGTKQYKYYVCSRSKVHENYNKCTHSKFYPAATTEKQVMEEALTFLEQIKAGSMRSKSDDTLNLSKIKMLETEVEQSDLAFRRKVYSLEKYVLIKETNEHKIEELKKAISEKTAIPEAEINFAIDELKTEKSPAKKRLVLQRYIKEIRLSPPEKLQFEQK